MSERELEAALRGLLRVLPDSVREDNESWGWCWDELDGDAQDSVKRARAVALDALEKGKT